MAKLTADQLIEAFKELTLIELSEFVKKFEEVFEVTAAAPVAVAAVAGGAAGGAAEAAEEKDSFDVILESAGDQKIQVIKEVRALTNLGLGEAKAVVDGAPAKVLEGVNKDFGTKICVSKAVFREAGERLQLRPLEDVTVKGRKTAVPVYELQGLKSSSLDAVPA